LTFTATERENLSQRFQVSAQKELPNFSSKEQEEEEEEEEEEEQQQQQVYICVLVLLYRAGQYMSPHTALYDVAAAAATPVAKHQYSSKQ
jgi:hypothetical protein